jgi:hypothetical protein
MPSRRQAPRRRALELVPNSVRLARAAASPSSRVPCHALTSCRATELRARSRRGSDSHELPQHRASETHLELGDLSSVRSTSFRFARRLFGSLDVFPIRRLSNSTSFRFVRRLSDSLDLFPIRRLSNSTSFRFVRRLPGSFDVFPIHSTSLLDSVDVFPTRSTSSRLVRALSDSPELLARARARGRSRELEREHDFATTPLRFELHQRARPRALCRQVPSRSTS